MNMDTIEFMMFSMMHSFKQLCYRSNFLSIIECAFLITTTILLKWPSPTIAISMTPEDYRQLVMNNCYNYTEYHQLMILGQRRPTGMTIDYFISLVEKIEAKLPYLNNEDLVTLLLKRFHYDGIENIGFMREHSYIVPKQQQKPRDVYRRAMNDMIFKNHSFNHRFPEEILTEDEKCALYYMISHTINQTIEYNYDSTEKIIQTELGIVSLLNNDFLAISLSRVLLGIKVALSNIEPMYFYEENDKLIIDPLLSVTLSDNLALTTFEYMVNYGNSLFGSQGKWNSTYCQTEYRLSTEGIGFTMAEINGGLDGWIIGNKIKSEKVHYLKNLKLSRMIDGYYSKDGLLPDLGICSMISLSPELIGEVQQTSIGYGWYWNKNVAYNNYEYEQFLGYNRLLIEQLNQKIQKSYEIKNGECSHIRSLNHFQDVQFDIKDDLYIMIDNNGYQYSKFHLEAITKLLTKMKALNILGKISILVNAHRGFDSEPMSQLPKDLQVPLHILTYNTSSVQMATCRLAWYTYRETTINNKKVLINYLVNFFERDNITHHLDKGHSKNFIWFSLKGHSYEQLTERERAYYYEQRWRLLYYFNVRVIFISSFEQHLDDDLSKLMLNQGDWFKVNPADFYEEIFIDRIVQRVMQTPIPVRLDDDCHNQTTFADNYLIGADKMQYWVLYPKYFLTSRSVHFKFETKTHEIHVCLGRYLFPEKNYTQCKESNQVTTSIEFTVERPCRWNNIESCLPIYFTIIDKHEKHLFNSECLKTDVCLSRPFDKIEWSISLSGMTCSTSNSIVFMLNFKLILLTNLLLLIFFLNIQNYGT